MAFLKTYKWYYANDIMYYINTYNELKNYQKCQNSVKVKLRVLSSFTHIYMYYVCMYVYIYIYIYIYRGLRFAKKMC